MQISNWSSLVSFWSMKTAVLTTVGFFAPFSFEPMTLASNCGAAILITSTFVKPKKDLQWMAQSVHQERWEMSQK